ncbi:MAG: SH3 domain-containing protein [Phocaeicola sp.]|uniref:SH3 domain-containing protein n=1 Tax=Phocaeicola sp. TaxID=2773926 RepID=UPI00300E797B
MRTLCLVIVILCCSVFATAQIKYEVTTSTFLNVRSYASTDAPVLGTINNGGEVYVYDIANGWAKISYDGGYAYISSDYITKVVDRTSMSQQELREFEAL